MRSTWANFRASLTGLTIFVLCVTSVCFRPVEADDDDDDDYDEHSNQLDDSQMPSLWTAAMSGSYHVLYSLEMGHITQKIEEWASFNERRFRLDLIDDSSGRRTSFLTNGHTRELFRFEPFTCARSDDGKSFEELNDVRPLFVGHVWDDKQADEGAFYAYGLGPLWLRAYKDGQKVVVDANSSEFRRWDVTFDKRLAGDSKLELPRKLRFHFVRNGRTQFVKMIDWFLDKNTNNDNQQQVRARVLLVDYNEDTQALRLPAGYGCSRRLELDPALQLDIGQVLFHQGTPNQAAFEVLTSSARDETSFSSSWINRKSSFRVVRLAQPKAYESTPTDSFYITTRQFRERAKLKHLKQVWWAPDNDHGQASVYTIDQTTGDCTFNQQNLNTELPLTFGEENRSATILFSLNQLAVLIGEFNSYHLIDPGEQIDSNGTKFRNRLYEKRLEKLAVRLADGSEQVWGPVSIVKQISTHSQYLERIPLKPKALHLSNDYEIKVMLFFLSDKADKMLHKAVLEMIENHEVSMSYAHEQLDVSQCFSADQEEELVLRYPMASVQQSRLLESKRETIKLLAADALLWDSGRAMNPLQVYNIKPTFDAFNMRLEVSLLDVPTVQSFKLELNLWLVEAPNLDFSERKQALIEVTASSGEICGQHCDFYNCFQFAYSPPRKACRVALDMARVKTTEGAHCQLYTYFERRPPKLDSSETLPLPGNLRVWFHQDPHERPHFDLNSMVELLEGLVELDEQSPYGKWLTLRVDLEPELDLRQPAIEADRPSEVLVLSPSSIEHNIEPMNEYSLEQSELADQDEASERAPNRTQRVKVTGSRQLRLEYKAALFDRTFASYTGETLKGVTYETCEQHCELNDCRSFAYCQMDETCQLSGQHQLKFLQSMSKVTPSLRHCNIYSLDYLSKFEPFGPVPAPENLPAEAGFSEPATSEADCASACMDHQEFVCQGFYLCHKPASKCYLMKTGASSSLESSGTSPKDAAAVAPERSAAGKPDECNYFERAYLNQFDRYLGKQLDQQEVATRLSVSASLQECARFCLRSRCLAFDACASPLGTKSIVFGSQTCHLLTESLHRRQLIPNKRCTTFVLSDKSHFNAARLELVYEDDGAKLELGGGGGKPDEEAKLNDYEAANEPNDRWPDQFDLVGAELEELEQFGRDRRKYASMQDGKPAALALAPGSTWLARVFSLSLGLALGSGLILAWNLAYARGWCDRLVGGGPEAGRQTPVAMSRLGDTSGWRRMF